jgi:Zn-finger nucleic acid-binding protein
MQLLTMGMISPTTWIAPETAAKGGKLERDDIGRAAANPFFMPLFEKKVEGNVARESCPRCRVPLVEERYEGAPILRCHFCQGRLLRGGVLGRIIAREQQTFTREEKKQARQWAKFSQGAVNDHCNFGDIACPLCGLTMYKAFHSIMVRTVLDRCPSSSCGAVWFDPGELEAIQILTEEAGKQWAGR